MVMQRGGETEESKAVLMQEPVDSILDKSLHESYTSSGLKTQLRTNKIIVPKLLLEQVDNALDEVVDDQNEGIATVPESVQQSVHLNEHVAQGAGSPEGRALREEAREVKSDLRRGTEPPTPPAMEGKRERDSGGMRSSQRQTLLDGAPESIISGAGLTPQLRRDHQDQLGMVNDGPWTRTQRGKTSSRTAKVVKAKINSNDDLFSIGVAQVNAGGAAAHAYSPDESRSKHEKTKDSHMPSMH